MFGRGTEKEKERGREGERERERQGIKRWWDVPFRRSIRFLSGANQVQVLGSSYAVRGNVELFTARLRYWLVRDVALRVSR